MPKPYAQLRAQMSHDAQRQAEDKARVLLAADTPTAAQLAYEAWVLSKEGRDDTAAAARAYAVWFRHTYPTAPHTAGYAWHLLAPDTRALWHDIAQAVLSATADRCTFLFDTR